MNWQDEHAQRIARLPDDIRAAHAHSLNHRLEVLVSELCGCFYCCSVFSPSEISEWVDEVGPANEGQTALCPRCGIDSVIGDKSGFVLSTHFLSEMKKHWF